MRIYNQKSIIAINEENAKREDRGNAIESLASELAKEKIKGMQKDTVIKQQNAEIVAIKLDIMKIKGGIE